jgi:F-type H+-transporting ATPase subunit b
MKMYVRTLILAGSALATSPLGLAAAESEGGGVFSVNPGLSVWTTVIFLMLLGVLWKFAWGPLLAAVEAREERIQSALDQSRTHQEEAEKLIAEHRAQLAEARRQAAEIVAESRSAAENLRRDLEAKAREEAQGIVEAARNEIERQKDQALAELRAESVDLALAAASRLLQERVDTDRDRQIVSSFLDDLTSGKAEGAQA